uniref:Uncharacterized protein n=1 Tax=Plectus sambesii TaxID=2011161 RepID=A0A914WI20_9BILA
MSTKGPNCYATVKLKNGPVDRQTRRTNSIRPRPTVSDGESPMCGGAHRQSGRPSLHTTEGNAVFDCDSRAAYTKVTLLTDCEGNIVRPNRVIIVPPPVGEATVECDLKCKMDKHLEKLRDYVVAVWERIKLTYDDVDKDKIINDIKEFIRKLLNK